MTNILTGYNIPLKLRHRLGWLVIGIFLLVCTSIWLPVWWQKAVYILAGSLLLFIYLSVEKIHVDEFIISSRTQKVLLGIILAALLLARLLPFVHSAIPLGYDTGLYREGIHRFADALPHLPDRSSTWAFERFQFLGYFIITDALSALHLPLDVVLYGSIILIDLFLTWMMFRYVRERAGAAYALLAAALFVGSFAHANLYWYFLAKNMLGLALLLPALQYLQKKSWWTLPYALAVMMTHLPTTLVLIGLAVWVLVLQPSRKFALKLAGIVAIAAVPIIFLNYEKLWGTVRLIQQKGLTSTLPVEEGIFITVQQYWQVSILFVPLAIIGLIFLWRRNRDAVVAGVGGSVIYAASPFLFHVRFTVFVDIFIQIAAGVGLWHLISLLVKSSRRRMIILCGLILMSCTAAIAIGWMIRPMYSNDQIIALRDIPTAAKVNQTKIMVIDSIFAPLTYGWSGLPTIAPGMLEFPTWDRQGWQDFWSGTPAQKSGMLSNLNQPLYIFDAARQMSGLDQVPGLHRINDYLYFFPLVTVQ